MEFTFEQIAKEMSDNGQWSPLFASEPKAEDIRMTNVTGKVVPFTLDSGRVVHSLEVVTPLGTMQFSISGDNTKTTYNIGSFVALRDYTSTGAKKTAYVAGQTRRIFAY